MDPTLLSSYEIIYETLTVSESDTEANESTDNCRFFVLLINDFVS